MDNHFGGIIWTNHALARLKERGVTQSDAWATWRNPESSRKGTSAGTWVYYKTYGGIRIEVVAKKNDKHEWLILSVWSRPVSQNYKKTESFWSFIIKKLFH
jgi:hypothetical protein